MGFLGKEREVIPEAWKGNSHRQTGSGARSLEHRCVGTCVTGGRNSRQRDMANALGGGRRVHGRLERKSQ